MILRKTIHDVRYAKRYSVALAKPLSELFNQPKPKFKFFVKNQTGLFGAPELISFEGFYAFKERTKIDCENLVDEIRNPNRKRNLVTIFDQLSNCLCCLADMAEFIRTAHPDKSFVAAAEDCCISMNTIVEKLNTNKDLYTNLKQVILDGDKHPMTEEDKHVGELFLFDFELNGIHLEERKRQYVVNLNNFILVTGQRFMTAVEKPRIVDPTKLPDVVSKVLSKEYNYNSEGKLIVSHPNSHSEDRILREAAFKVYNGPNAESEELLDNLLESRHKLALTCGFPSYAHRALKNSIAENPCFVMEFLNILNTELRIRSVFDYKTMKRANNNDIVSPWDVQYLTNKIKQNHLKYAMIDYASYFSLGDCMEGLNMIFNSLYNINLVFEDIKPGEGWAEQIYKLAVTHNTEGLLGYIYCDFFERTGKLHNDSHYVVRGGRLLPDNSYQTPIVVVMLNVVWRENYGPVLLHPGSVENLFHEFGHAIHSMLGRTRYQHVNGTRCATDLAEFPSVLMEYYATQPQVIKQYAKHFKTRQPMPDDMLKKLCTSKYLFAASEMQLQLFYSVLDQYYHTQAPQSLSTTDSLAKLQVEYYGLPYVKNTAWQLHFSHFVGYGAKYYSYLVSKALAAHTWHSFLSNDPLNRIQGERLRTECLQYGGGKPARKLVSDYLRTPVTPELLASSLIQDIDQGNEFSKFSVT
ncbi:mitochondrial intermediate peptidase [Melanaphis sacchari]|nr:mitochondrial intermediate peptidase [Melanaphis sacchari]